MSLLKSKNLFLFVALGLYLVFSFFQLNKPFIYDEVDFATVKIPMLLQPPTYQWLLQMISKFTDNYEVGFRLFGIAVNLLSAFFIFLIANKFKKGSGIVATILYLLMPVVVQGSMLLDIDNTILNLAVLVFLYLYIITIGSRFRFLYYFLGFLLIFWIKPTTIYALWFAVAFYDWLSFKKIWNVFYITVVFIVASLLYKFSLFEYSRVVGLDFYGVITSHDSVDLGNLLRNILGIKIFAKAVYYLSSVLLWSMPFLFFYIFVVFFKKKALNEPEKLLILLIVSIALPYLFIRGTAGGFPKYLFPIFSLFCILSAINIEEEVSRIFNIKNLLILFLASSIFYFLGDPLRTPFVVKEVALANTENVIQLGVFFIKYYFALTLVGVLMYMIFQSERSILILLALGYGLSLNIIQMQADYSVRYAYGEKNVWPIINYFKENNVDYKNIRTIKHVVYYLSSREVYKENELVISAITPVELTKMLSDKNVEYLAFSFNSYFLNKDYSELKKTIADSNFKEVKQISDYLIFKR